VRTRVAIVGTPELLAECAPDRPARGIEPLLVSTSDLEVLERSLSDLAPEVVVALASRDVELEPLSVLQVPTILWFTSPGITITAADGPNRRLVGDAPGVWRWPPLPVADRCFVSRDPPFGRAAWISPDGPRRREYLAHLSHSVEVLREGDDAAVAMNLHEEDAPAFEPRAARALAGGRLLVSETLQPSRGLEPGVDYLEARDLHDLFMLVENAVERPEAFERVRRAGRRKAECFRASLVFSRLVNDLQLELSGA
jgi:hypothetical protein